MKQGKAKAKKIVRAIKGDHFTTGDIAKKLKINPETVRLWAVNKTIPAGQKTAGGHRRYTRTQFERIVARRKAS